MTFQTTNEDAEFTLEELKVLRDFVAMQVWQNRHWSEANPEEAPKRIVQTYESILKKINLQRADIALRGISDE